MKTEYAETAIVDLTLARELLADYKAWTQSAEARSKSGQDVAPIDPKACKWCMSGAVMFVAQHADGIQANRGRQLKAFEFLSNAIQHFGGLRNIAGFNDTLGRTHREVLAALDKAIELAEAEAAL